MEYVHGCDLRQWMYLYNPFDNNLIRHIAKEALTGLAYLHDKVKAVHRDISTTNIIMDVTCRVKIIDMGCALRLDARSLATEPARSNRVLFNVGIEHFRAPEALAHRGWYFVSDIWSLGMVLLFVFSANSHNLVDHSSKSLASSLLRRLPALAQTGQMGELLSMMMTANEAQRPTAQTLLGHPWFAYS
ncbi:kinase-like protein [Cylindrobasidium torrendii FP15055 ss-10]|uniref:non-specific serine/threonine protein kinase n=1 Tax=Cylindrobasidium torrendii FP15055 ss-10 TaxID=1314674 RepID=A0A0D7BPZ5_9AGAR|nr:kinase-like protein [Cylindrobasidium torrendii FP15055 ss-10]